jgi:hypothetical protein
MILNLLFAGVGPCFILRIGCPMTIREHAGRPRNLTPLFSKLIKLGYFQFYFLLLSYFFSLEPRVTNKLAPSELARSLQTISTGTDHRQTRPGIGRRASGISSFLPAN